ncbi:MAG TPA: hypothetical protein VFO28_08815, partial [Burkholderiaceae bacterium]|nr:hypothetical protein [Burkholderiaceae bacterium]
MGSDARGELLEVVKELLPASRRVALLWNPGNDSHPHYVGWFETHAAALGLSLVATGVSQVEGFAGAFRQLKAAGAGSV